MNDTSIDEPVIYTPPAEEEDTIQAAFARLPAKAPDISHLQDAVVKDSLGRWIMTPIPGQQLIVERLATILDSRPWLDTKIYTVVWVDEASGNVTLWDDDLHRNSSTNYVSGIKSGYRFKLPPKRGKWDAPPPPPTLVTTPVPTDEDGNPIKRRRGRPAGMKNRPKDVIKAEKAARREEQKLKASRRAMKKAAKNPSKKPSKQPTTH
jgi:hypothetical protein